MNNIKLEDAPVEVVQQVLNTFIHLDSFFPVDSTIAHERIKSHDFILTEEDKKSTVDFIYTTIKNLITHHLKKNISDIEAHPDISNKTIKNLFNEEKKFLDNFPTLALTIKKENTIKIDDYNVIIDRDKIIEKSLYDQTKEKINMLFKKQLSSFGKHVIFDSMIFQVNNKNDNHNFILNMGLDFIEQKNISNNKNELSETYIENIFKSFDYFNAPDVLQIKTLNIMSDFFSQRYIKDNQKQIIDKINNKSAELLALPNNITDYNKEYPKDKIKKIDWSVFFSYSDEKQFHEVIDVLFATNSVEEDLKFAESIPGEDFDLLASMPKSDSLLGHAFKFLTENKKPDGSLSDLTYDLERIIYQKIEFNQSPDFLTQNKKNQTPKIKI